MTRFGGLGNDAKRIPAPVPAQDEGRVHQEVEGKYCMLCGQLCGVSECS